MAMKRIIGAFLLVISTLLLPTDLFGLTGVWRGNLNLGQMSLPLLFNFSETAHGITHGTLDSPAQGAAGIPTEVLLCTADSISLTCNAIGASYTGTISSAIITGQFRQSGYSFPLDLTPETPIEERRPQTPRPPFCYQIIDTAFTTADGAVLSATLTLPSSANSCKIPAVVMVTGSGPQNRDEEIFEHRPFAVIADYLARNGIASLRYDDRGFARSTGDYASATTDTFRDDALCGIHLLRGFDSIGNVGVLGHSEGGTIAYMLAADSLADFIISLAGMAVSGKETMLRQNEHRLTASGMPDTDRNNSLNLIGLMFDAIAQQAQHGISHPIDIDSLSTAADLSVPPQIMASLRATQSSRSPWLDRFISLNPRIYLKDVKCPLLAINGNLDTQVSPENLEVIRGLVPQATIITIPGLNHLLQHAVTGEVDEYSRIRETIAPEVLEAIVCFITALTHE